MNGLEGHNKKLELLPREFNQPIFILGIMRSGTTLLLNILTEHPQLLKIGVELNTTWTAIGGAPIVGECKYRDESDINPVCIANMTNYFSESIWRYKSFRQQWKRKLFKHRYGSGGVYKDWDNIYPVNKSPHLTNKVKYLHAMFPKARFIMIVRGIEAQAYSQKRHFLKDLDKRNMLNFLPYDEKQCWTRLTVERMNENADRVFPGNFSVIPEAWINLNYLALKELEEIGKENFHAFNYEDLIEKPTSILSDVFSFLELKKDYQYIEKKIMKRERKGFNAHTSDPVNEWKRGLNNEEIMIIKKVVDENIMKYDFIRRVINTFK